MTQPNDPEAVWRARDFAVVIAIALFMQLLDYHGFFAVVEGKAANWFLTFETERSRSPRIVTVSIGDHDYETLFKSASPLDPLNVVRIVRGLQDAGALIVGVDLLTEQASYEALARDRSELLGDAIVWAAPSERPQVVPAPFLSWLIGGDDEVFARPGAVLGQDALAPTLAGGPRQVPRSGIPVFPVEDDRAVRRVPRVWQTDATDTPRRTFAAEVTQAYCEKIRTCENESDEVLVSYGSLVSLDPDYFVYELLDCGPSPQDVGNCSPRGDAPLENAIVLLGGTFAASRDFFDTASGHIPGLILNAHAVQALIHGPAVAEMARPRIFLLDVIIGLLMLAPFRERFRSFVLTRFRRTPLLGSRIHPHSSVPSLLVGLTIAFLAALVSVPLLWWWDVLWVSWAGMLLIEVPEIVKNLLNHVPTKARETKTEHT